MTPSLVVPAYPPVLTLKSEEAPQTEAQCCAHSDLCILRLGQPGAAMLTPVLQSEQGSSAGYVPEQHLGTGGPQMERVQEGLCLHHSLSAFLEACTHHENRNQHHLAPVFVERKHFYPAREPQS